MAKWGEGDPRWIVEDRPDSTNVNNWHWSELNCLPTVQAFVKKHLVGIETLENGQRGSVTSVSDVKGDATMVNRKGKVRTFFDLTITCEVQVTIDGTPLKTTLTMNEVNQDEEAEDYTVDISTPDADAAQKKKIREVVRALLEKVHDALANKMIAELRAENEKKVLLPTATNNGASDASKSDASSSTPSAAAAVSAAASTKQTRAGVRLATVKVEVDLLASASDVFQTLTDVNRVRIWTQSDATISPAPNTPFSLFGGNVSGTMVEVEKDRRLVQSWRLSSWPIGHMSTVTLTLEQGHSSTTVTVEQADVPSDQADSTRASWHRMIFDRIKQVFGWGFAHHDDE